MKIKIPEGTFCHSVRVGFADTDAMGVAHHSVYLRYFEMARVAWMRETGLIETHYPKTELTLAVLESDCRHYGVARFDELLRIFTRVRLQRLKIQVQYAILREQSDDVVATGQTILVPVGRDLKAKRPPPQWREKMERASWTETWL